MSGRSIQQTLNIRLLLEYDGEPYAGWQRQKTGPSVQQALEDALEKVLGGRVPVIGASRTDSGVHARGQVASFLTSKLSIEAKRWAAVLNDSLPPSVRVIESSAAPNDFHPTRAAVSKLYEYVVLNRSVASALDRRVYFVPRALCWRSIATACRGFVGTHDFRAFQGAKSTVKTTVRTVLRCSVHDRGEGFFAIRVHGTGFLKQQVRAMVGTLVEIGLGKRHIEDVGKILRGRDRQSAGHTAPAAGLTLVKIFFPGEHG